MGYDTNELIEKAVKILESNTNIVFIEEISVAMGISKQTFYVHKLDEVDVIKDLLNRNRVNIKQKLRTKWFDNDNATTQIALYRLTADKNEFQRLTTNDITSKGEKIETQIVVNNFLDLDERIKQIKGE